MMNRLNKVLLGMCLFAVCLSAKAQPIFNFNELQALYPGKDVIILNQKEHLVIKKSDDGLKIFSDKSSEILYLSEKASHLLNKSIYYYDHFSAVRDIDANSWIPDGEGKKLKRINVQNIYTRKTVNEDVFYDDIHEKYFTYPSLKKGAVSTLSYSEDIFDPHFLSTFYFGTYAPIESAEFRVTLPEDVSVRYVIKDPEGRIKFREEHSKNTITYIFSSGRSSGFAIEDDAPSSSHFLPHVIVYIDKYQLKGKEKKILSDVNELYAWYQELLSHMRNENRKELKELSDSLTRNTTSVTEKIRNVFYYVQEEIKYIAFEDGLGGFIPREPIDTYNKKFGDCKDKAMLINALLQQAGIESYPVWIGTRDIPYSYSEVPTPQSDNHMISAVKVNDNWVFLDGTAVHLQYGLPTSMIQGKEALIGISKDSFNIVKVPEMDKSQSIFRENYSMTLDEGKIKGNGVSVCTGYFKQHLYYNMIQGGFDKQTQFLNDRLDLGNNKYVATNMLLHPGYDNRDSSMSYSFNFVIDDYVAAVDNKIFVNLHIKKPEGFDKIDIAKRFSEKVNDFRNTEYLETVFDVPSGYEITSVPASKEYHSKGFGFNVSYVKKGNQVRLIREIYHDALSVKKADFAAWNEFVEKLGDASKELVILKKI